MCVENSILLFAFVWIATYAMRISLYGAEVGIYIYLERDLKFILYVGLCTI